MSQNLSDVTEQHQQENQFDSLMPRQWRSLIIIVLILGIFFRFAHLDQKVYWHDEIYTSLRISGYNSQQVHQQLYTDKVINISAIRQYQCPSAENSLADTIRGLATDVPQHPPLFYSLLALWTRWFGCSVAVARSLSVLFSLLIFPAIYWLCLELFSSQAVGWMAMALVAVSPMQIRYAQEARQYSLWALLILLSCTLLLRAIKRKTLLNWSLYAITVSLSLYCHLLSLFVLIGQVIYVIALKGLRRSQTFIIYLLVGLATFIPWGLTLINNKNQAEQTANWLAQSLPILSLLKKWVLNLSRIFISWNYE